MVKIEKKKRIVRGKVLALKKKGIAIVCMEEIGNATEMRIEMTGQDMIEIGSEKGRITGDAATVSMNVLDIASVTTLVTPMTMLKSFLSIINEEDGLRLDTGTDLCDFIS